jgi:DUF4097 and DUF4098 domain-containing protein YvlB
MVVAALSGFTSVAPAQQFSRAERIDTTVAMERRATLSVSVYSGRVNVIGGSGSSARIVGRVDRGEVEIRARLGNVSVNAQPDGGRGGSAELDITVPVGTRVVLESFSAPLSIRGVKGEVKTESLSGSVQVTDAVGKVSVEAVSGRIEVSQVDGDVRAEAVSGTVTISDVEGDVESESVSGRVSILRSKSKSVRAESVSGSVTYSGTFDPAGNYVFKSHSGVLTVGMPPQTGATVSLQTYSGNVDSDFPVTLESGKSRMGHESQFEFRIGNGRSRIVLETFSGNIRIQRSANLDEREQ